MSKTFAAVAIVVGWGLLASGERHGLFSTYDTIELRLDAPFEELFARAKGEPDYEVDGTLRVGSESSAPAAPVVISLRGHTSRRDTECTFPKLKLALSDRAAAALSLESHTLKIGTHCGESEDDVLTEKFGRLPNERSPWREAAVYRILDALKVPTLRTRPARITYVYTSMGSTESREKTDEVTRNAILLEDEDEAIERLGGNGEIDADEFTTAAALFPPDDASSLAFAEALIGNFDWCVKFSAGDTYRCDARLKLWNVIAANKDSGRARPIMYDFDVSGMVTGSHRWFSDVFNAAFVASGSAREVEVIAQLQRTRSLFSRAQLDRTRDRFMAGRDAAYGALDAARVDGVGRRQIREYLDAFYREIATDRFYRPVVIRRHTMLKAAAEPSAATVCANRGPVPVGTPVTDPLAARGGMIKVAVLDALWHWAPPARCAAVQNGTAWVEADAVSRDYPPR